MVGMPLAVLAAIGLDSMLPISEAPWRWLVCEEESGHDHNEQGPQLEMETYSVKVRLGNPNTLGQTSQLAATGSSPAGSPPHEHQGHFPTMGTAAVGNAHWGNHEDKVVTL